MNSLDKTHWYQKKSFLLWIAGAATAVAALPGIPAIVKIVATLIAGGCGGAGLYGAVEVNRAAGAATQAQVVETKALVDATKNPNSTLTAD